MQVHDVVPGTPGRLILAIRKVRAGCLADLPYRQPGPVPGMDACTDAQDHLERPGGAGYSFGYAVGF